MKKRLNLLLTMYFVLALELGYHFFLSVEKLLRYDSYVVASRERTIDTLFVLFVCGCGLFVYYKKGRKIEWKSLFRRYINIYNVFLFLFFAWLYFICWRGTFLHNSFGLSANSEIIASVAVRVFLAFLYAQFCNGERKYINIIFTGIIVFTTVLVVILLSQLILHGEMLFRSDKMHVQVYAFFEGSSLNSLGRLTINFKVNLYGMYAKTVIMMCVYMFFVVKNKWRYLYIVASGFHYIILAFTDCRSGLLSTAIGIGMVIALFTWRKLEMRKPAFRILMVCVAFCAAFLMVDAMRQPTVNGYRLIRSAITGEKLEFSSGKRELLRNSSGRGEIYMAAIRCMKNPEIAIFGATPAGVVNEISKEFHNPRNLYTHNEFLEIMVASGVVGLFLFLCWLFSAAWCGMKVFFNFRGRFTIEERILMVLCLMELANNMLEARLTFKDNLGGLVFYLTAGYAVALMARLKAKEDAIEL